MYCLHLSPSFLTFIFSININFARFSLIPTRRLDITLQCQSEHYADLNKIVLSCRLNVAVHLAALISRSRLYQTRAAETASFFLHRFKLTCWSIGLSITDTFLGGFFLILEGNIFPLRCLEWTLCLICSVMHVFRITGSFHAPYLWNWKKFE